MNDKNKIINATFACVILLFLANIFVEKCINLFYMQKNKIAHNVILSSNANTKINNDEILLPYISQNIKEYEVFLTNNKNSEIIYNLKSQKIDMVDFLNYETLCDYYQTIDLKNYILFIGRNFINNKLMPELLNKNTKNVTPKKTIDLCQNSDFFSAEKIDNERIFIACKEAGIYNPYTEKLEKIKSDYSIEVSLMSKLPTGKILIIGENYDKQGKLKNVLIFNPKTKGFEEGSKMQEPRIPSQILSLNNGNKIIISGFDLKNKKKDELLKSIELYDYKNNNFVFLGSVNENRTTLNQAFLINNKYLYFPISNNIKQNKQKTFSQTNKFFTKLKMQIKKPKCELFDIEKGIAKYTKICPNENYLYADFINLDSDKILIIGTSINGTDMITFYTKYLK